MRICLASIHPRLLSGQIEGLIALRAALEPLGHTVDLVSAFEPEELRAQRRWTRRTASQPHLTPKLLRIGATVRALLAAAKHCDVVHLNVPTPAFAALADAVRLLARRPMVLGFEAHLADVPQVARRLLAAPEFYLPRLLINNGLLARATMHGAERYVVSSGYQRSELLGLGYERERIAVIPNLADTAKLRRWPRGEARRALGLPEGPLVGFVGHYHDVKGHDVLIRAFPRLRATVPGACLALAWSGVGNQMRVRAEIRRAQISDGVIELERVDVGQLFSAVDVLALPYRLSIGQAAFPGTVLEAMWVGVPLVTSRLPLFAELVEHERTALLTAPDDPHDLAEQISRLLTDRDLAAHLVQGQGAAVAEHFHPKRLAREYLATYEQALAKQARVLQTA